MANKANLFTLCFFLGFLLLCVASFILSVSTAWVDANGEVAFQPLFITLFSISLILVGISFVAFLVLLILHLVRKAKMKKNQPK